MALRKTIKQNDGVCTDYHRILFLQITPNRQNSIALLSYVDEECRMNEKTEGISPYKSSITYETTYDDQMTVETAYEYLKTLPAFKDAEDV